MVNELQKENDILMKNQDNDKKKDSKQDEISILSKQGYQLLKENKLKDAYEAFNKILELDENNNYALVGLGDCSRKQNNLNNAVQYYSKCLQFHPSNNYALFGLADCYKSLNQFHKAIEIWEQYLIHDDRNITVLTRIADAYRKIKDLKRLGRCYKNFEHFRNRFLYATRNNPVLNGVANYNPVQYYEDDDF